MQVFLTSLEEDMKHTIITAMKTNAMRILDSMNIEYSVLEYEWDEDHLDAVHLADTAGIDYEHVYKTIVMRTGDRRLFVFCLPADFSISLKKARVLTEAKEIDLLPMNELQKNTGYIRGGCSPLGMIKKYPTFIEETAQLEDYICVSAGVRGTMLRLNPEDLARALQARFADFS